MRPLKFLLQKEFRQMLRDKGFAGRLFIAPLIQLILLPMAANYTIKNINIAIVDHDHSSVSSKLTDKILSSGYFKLAAYTNFNTKAGKELEADRADIILEIPQNFEQQLIHENIQKVAIEVNAINGVKATIGFGYLSGIIADYNAEIRTQWIQPSRMDDSPFINVVSSFWYNPRLTYYIYMVPAILVSLVTGVAGLSAAFNIVKEKEIGTIEQINVTPIKKHHFILGKLIPYMAVGFVVFAFGLLIGYVLYGIVPLGNIAILLMSGLYSPIDSMPVWAQFISHCFPISYFIDVMRMVVIKGSGLLDIWPQIWHVLLIGIVLNGWAILNYRKTS